MRWLEPQPSLTTDKWSGEGSSLEDIVADAVLNCQPGTTYLAAVSGGADSVAMLSALASIRNKTFDLRCIHIEHGIRPQAESRGDAEFVKRLCGQLQIKCKTVTIKPGRIADAAKELGIGIEASARLFRRRAWFREAKRLETSPEKHKVRILVAHTADDALETTLMRIFRGSGPSGLAPMPANKGRIIRPLINLRHSDIIAYLTEKKLTWREDSSNSDIRFLRNRVRHNLIPHLSESFPNWRTALGAFAKTQSLTADFIQNEASARVSWQSLDGSQDTALYTDARNFFAQPAIIREEALFQGIDALLALLTQTAHPHTVKRANIRRFCEGEKKAVDFGSLRLCKNTKSVILSIPDRGEYGFSLLINKPGLYTLKSTAIQVCEIQKNGNEGEDAFFALMPLAIRPGFKEDTVLPKGAPLGACPGKISGKSATAVDALGVAARILQGRLAWRRDSAVTTGAAANDRICIVRIGGTDVR